MAISAAGATTAGPASRGCLAGADAQKYTSKSAVRNVGCFPVELVSCLGLKLSGASEFAMLQGFLGSLMGLFLQLSDEGWGPLYHRLRCAHRLMLKYRLVFNNNLQLRNEKFVAFVNCQLLLNNYPSFCPRLDI